MMHDINLPLILGAALLATASPGPATLAIAGTSMSVGRAQGLAVASGVTTGSWMWSIMAAAGLGALMQANAWAFEVLRYCGAGYLLFLSVKSGLSAWRGSKAQQTSTIIPMTKRAAYGKGLALHLTNPKAILFFGALFAIGVPPNSPPSALATIIVAVGLQSMLVFHGYALLFSRPALVTFYTKLRRWFEAGFALAFGAAGVKILTTKLT
ncbi:MAG: LysE family translocator [Alphaproteobacteria bacterium]|nr:LysE family translocator [Alphaproteobacteria bacterium]